MKSLFFATLFSLASIAVPPPAAAEPAKADAASFASPEKRDLLFRMAAEQSLILHPNASRITPDMLAEHKAVLHGLVRALDVNGPVAAAFNAQHHRYNKKYYHALSDELFDHRDIVSVESTTESMLSIMLNRQSDLRVLAALLNADELEKAIMHYRGTRDARVKNFTVSGKGKDKLVNSILQPKQFARAEPAVHMYATAKGHAIEHAILARVFAEGGAVETAMVKALQAELPKMNADKLADIAKFYIGDRRYFATRVAKNFRLDSEVVNEALEKSKALQTHYHGK